MGGSPRPPSGAEGAKENLWSKLIGAKGAREKAKSPEGTSEKDKN